MSTRALVFTVNASTARMRPFKMSLLVAKALKTFSSSISFMEVCYATHPVMLVIRSIMCMHRLGVFLPATVIVVSLQFRRQVGRSFTIAFRISFMLHFILRPIDCSDHARSLSPFVARPVVSHELLCDRAS